MKGTGPDGRILKADIEDYLGKIINYSVIATLMLVMFCVIFYVLPLCLTANSSSDHEITSRLAIHSVNSIFNLNVFALFLSCNFQEIPRSIPCGVSVMLASIYVNQMEFNALIVSHFFLPKLLLRRVARWRLMQLQD